MEETRRRTEASLAKKRINTNLANGLAGSDSANGPPSPVPSGAMDSLLEKLRAAAPQARDQRDRRRRARLKERHQVRVASGQHMPDLSGMGSDGENGDNGGNGQDVSKGANREAPSSVTQLNESSSRQEGQVSESEDVADRAASMLQGLRGDGDADAERARRRESAEVARRNRRMRRKAAATSGSKNNVDGTTLSTVREAGSPTKANTDEADDSSPTGPSMGPGNSFTSATPAIVVSSAVDGGA